MGDQPAVCKQADVDVGAPHREHRDPRPEAVPDVEDGGAPPDPVPRPDAALAVLAAADPVPEGVASEGVGRETDDVDEHDRVAEPEVERGRPVPEPCRGGRPDERVDGVVPEHHDLGHGQVHDIPVQVVPDPEPRLAAVGAALGLRVRARPGVEQIAAVVGLPVVVAGEAEEEGDGRDPESGRDVQRPDVDQVERGVERAQVAMELGGCGVEERDGQPIEGEQGVDDDDAGGVEPIREPGVGILQPLPARSRACGGGAHRHVCSVGVRPGRPDGPGTTMRRICGVAALRCSLTSGRTRSLRSAAAPCSYTTWPPQLSPRSRPHPWVP